MCCCASSLLWEGLLSDCSLYNVSFMGTNLPNHNYMDLTLVGDAGDGSDIVQCHAAVLLKLLTMKTRQKFGSKPGSI